MDSDEEFVFDSDASGEIEFDSADGNMPDDTGGSNNISLKIEDIFYEADDIKIKIPIKFVFLCCL